MQISEYYRSTKFLGAKNLKLMPAMLEKMVRNRINFNLRDSNLENHHRDRLEAFHHAMVAFCEDHNVGMWSHDNRSWYHDEDFGIIEDKQSEHEEVFGYTLHIVMFFECTEDADRYVRDFLVLYKLSN